MFERKNKMKNVDKKYEKSLRAISECVNHINEMCERFDQQLKKYECRIRDLEFQLICPHKEEFREVSLNCVFNDSRNLNINGMFDFYEKCSVCGHIIRYFENETELRKRKLELAEMKVEREKMEYEKFEQRSKIKGEAK